MSDNKFWLGINAIFVTGVCIIALSGMQYFAGKNQKIVELIKNGTPAVEALCALDDVYGKNPTCVISALKRQ